MAGETHTPEVLWAQRSSKTDETKNFIYVTITVPDVPASNLKLDLKDQGLTFTGHSDTLKRTYHLELEFYGKINVSESKVNHTGKNLELKLRKADLAEEYWPRLLKESKKVHFLKTDFDKWVDEDEQNEAAEDDFSNFGGMGGMPGMGGGDFGGIDFSKLGGGGGLPTGEEDEEEDEEESDDDMPPLEGDEEEDKAAGKAKASA
ncbi:HSP20-like chaperone [Thozetella sp. PMI_491]|nr:HSP20-like chaperone [Thozetella sp. PMI_491]